LLDENALTQQIKKEFINRLIINLLDIIIMAHFQDQPFSGYDVVQFIYREFGLQISPGTVYSTLYSIERKMLITGTNIGRKRIFKVTHEGKLTVKAFTDPKEMEIFIKRIAKRQ
jgi:DNA-binding PadR family transcriptional regulator